MVSCGIALRAEQIKEQLPVPLETTHLVLVQHAPLAIRFRFDEKRFDVDGAYDIRYEIVKKRIDKALIKGTSERVTQPGTIAIIYSQPTEAVEYRGYIEYLQSLGYLSRGIEELELEELQGVHVFTPLRYYVDLAILTLALVASLVHLGWVVWRSLRPVEPVPVPLPPATAPRDAAWYAAEARRLSAAGRFAEALGVRFVAAVLDLDERRVVQFHPSKTPAEYALEARLDAAGRSGLSDLVASLYRHVFGGTPCDAEQWHRFDALAAGLRLHAATR